VITSKDLSGELHGVLFDSREAGDSTLISSLLLQTKSKEVVYATQIAICFIVPEMD